mmetsp:Transcript_14512/g.26690  ORF Transcript_14512/g.26690 Transcript_14512/m.26690 type:complete len:120 (-) Transcript_14512:66-425(-)
MIFLRQRACALSLRKALPSRARDRSAQRMGLATTPTPEQLSTDDRPAGLGSVPMVVGLSGAVLVGIVAMHVHIFTPERERQEQKLRSRIDTLEADAVALRARLKEAEAAAFKGEVWRPV